MTSDVEITKDDEKKVLHELVWEHMQNVLKITTLNRTIKEEEEKIQKLINAITGGEHGSSVQ